MRIIFDFIFPGEYVRALNATKLDRVFAKPFVGNLAGHREGVTCFSKDPQSLSSLTSGAYDGEVREWDLVTQKCRRAFVAHEGYVRGIAYLPTALSATEKRFLTCGDDKTVKLWKSAPAGWDDTEIEEPIATMLSRNTLTDISHHQYDNIYATSGEVCSIWEHSRNEPLNTFKWGVDTMHAIAFNPIETSLLATCASDRSIIFYDRREAKPLRKIVMTLRANRLRWNPMAAFNFTVANEDYNLYTFDTRRLENPIKIHKDHVNAVTDVDYAPTGKEIVSSSYDRTIRIYDVEAAHSREVYHTKRMQHVTCIGWSLDNKYIYSGSDEMNIRLWKAYASEKLGAVRARERAKLEYNEALKEKFAAHPQIKRIARHRHVPKGVMNATKKHRIIRDKETRKEHNRRVHSAPGTVPFVAEKTKSVLREEK